MKLLIADCGATKCQWIVADGSGIVRCFNTEGFNPAVAGLDRVRHELFNLSDVIGSESPDRIFFYGAGCSGDEICDKISDILMDVTGCHCVEVASDLLGAARALCGSNRGIACILGTGSNSCLYDGCRIADNIPPLGFILGDEGSGAVLGRMFLSDLFKGLMPQKLVDMFFDRYQIDKDSVIKSVYRDCNPNGFLASFVPFIHENRQDPYLHKMILDNFDRFFTRNVMQYQKYRTIPIGFIGSVAFYFQEELSMAAERAGFRIGPILQTPETGLVEYHLGKIC